jgi:DNA polymerase phi
MSHDDVSITLKSITHAGMAMTPEGLAVWLVASQAFPDVKVKPWTNPLAKKSLSDVAAILKESFQDGPKDTAEQSRNKQPNWTAQLHFVWDIILAHYLRDEDGDKEAFDHFWTRVVDGKRVLYLK